MRQSCADSTLTHSLKSTSLKATSRRNSSLKIRKHSSLWDAPLSKDPWAEATKIWFTTNHSILNGARARTEVKAMKTNQSARAEISHSPLASQGHSVPRARSQPARMASRGNRTGSSMCLHASRSKKVLNWRPSKYSKSRVNFQKRRSKPIWNREWSSWRQSSRQKNHSQIDPCRKSRIARGT